MRAVKVRASQPARRLLSRDSDHLGNTVEVDVLGQQRRAAPHCAGVGHSLRTEDRPTTIQQVAPSLANDAPGFGSKAGSTPAQGKESVWSRCGSVRHPFAYCAEGACCRNILMRSGLGQEGWPRLTAQIIAGEAATATKEPTMSPPNPRRSADAATREQPAGRPIQHTSGGSRTSVVDIALVEGDLVKGQYLPQWVAPALLGPPRTAPAYRWSDPSNYLG